MNAAVRYAAAALLIGLLAALCAAAGMLERQLAGAQRHLAVADLAAADEVYAALEHQLGRAGRAAALLPGVRDAVAARRVAIRYWRGDYAALRDSDLAQSDDLLLRMTLANAAYRMGQRPDASPEQVLDSLDRAVVLYAALLQDGGGGDVAYNYELLVGLRERIAAGADAMGAPLESPLGMEGAQPLDEETGLDDVQIFVPMMQDDRERVDDPTPGGDPPIRRRG